MQSLRRAFYLFLGFTFPGFWMFHAAGFWGSMYKPVQIVCGTEASGWPSLVTAVLLYLGWTLIFEFTYRLLVRYHP